MATLDKNRIAQLRGQDVVGRDEEKIGSLAEIYVDAETDEPEWALVNTGLFGTKSAFVPLRDATEVDGTLHVPFDKATVKEAPKMDPDGNLSQSEESELYRYYGMSDSETSGGTRDEAQRTAGTATPGESDDAMTRSEEELAVGKTERETGAPTSRSTSSARTCRRPCRCAARRRGSSASRSPTRTSKRPCQAPRSQRPST